MFRNYIYSFQWYKQKKRLKALILDLSKIDFETHKDHIGTNFNNFDRYLDFYYDSNFLFSIDFKDKKYFFEHGYDCYLTEEDYINGYISTCVEPVEITEELMQVINKHLKGFEEKKIEISAAW